MLTVHSEEVKFKTISERDATSFLHSVRLFMARGLTAIITAIVLVGLTSFQERLPKIFVKLLERGKIAFIRPDSLVETPIVENDQMNYEYALKFPEKNFEVRYAIRPLDIIIKDYQSSVKKKKDGDIILHPNKYYSASFQATLLNISGGQLPEIATFDSGAVKEEFNADWGATTFVEVDGEFGQSYKYCIVVALHKDDRADAYIFFLSDTKIDFEKNMENAFHSLRFK